MHFFRVKFVFSFNFYSDYPYLNVLFILFLIRFSLFGIREVFFASYHVMYDFTFSIVLDVHSTAAFWTGDNGSLKCDTINHFFFIDFSRMRLYKGFIIP